MEWLGGWLKSVITILLLATFVDLLLPSDSMQRYVKTVMSLFILLVLLTPMIDLFQKKWDVDQLLASAERKQQEAEPGSRINMPSLQTINRQADSFKAAGEKQTQQMIQAQLAGLVKEDLEKQTSLKIGNVAVAAKTDNNGKPYIDHVQVTLEIEKQAKPENADDGRIAAIKPIEPVKRVLVDISEEVDSAAAGDPFKPSPELEQEKLRITNQIINNWQVDPDRIDIRLQAPKKVL